MSLLLPALAVIGLCILIVLLLPLELSGTLIASQKLSASFEGRWGVLGIRASERDAEFMLFSYPVFRKPFGGEKEEATEEEAAGTRDKLDNALTLWPEIRGPLRDFLRQVSVQRLSCDLTLGLGNPASTGICYGIYYAVKGMLSPLQQVSLVMRPEFTSQVIEGKATLDITVRRAVLSALPFAVIFIKRRRSSA